VSGSTARVAVSGKALNGTVIRVADGTDEGEQTDPPYRCLEDGDVVQVVWRSEDGATTTVLQRYVVDEDGDDS